MGMCAIYTAIPPPSADEILALARSNEGRVHGVRRCTLGRRAVAELVVLVAPPTHASFAAAILERDLWGFLTPAASRGNHVEALRQANQDLVLPIPLWPESPELACLVGAPPAHYIGNNLAMLPAELVRAGVEAFQAYEATSDAAEYLNAFLRSVQARGEVVLLHWDYR